MSRRRTRAALISYSDSPVRKRRLVTRSSATSRHCPGTPWPSLLRVRETSANPIGRWVSLPAKMTSSMARPRRSLGDCEPMDHRMASRIFDLPQPFGPTTPVTPSSMSSPVLVRKDLNPRISMRRSFIERAPARPAPGRSTAESGAISTGCAQGQRRPRTLCEWSRHWVDWLDPEADSIASPIQREPLEVQDRPHRQPSNSHDLGAPRCMTSPV